MSLLSVPSKSDTLGLDMQWVEGNEQGMLLGSVPEYVTEATHTSSRPGVSNSPSL